MSRARARTVATAVLAVLLVALPLLPAVATTSTRATTGRIVSINPTPDDDGLAVVFQADNLPAGGSLDPKSIVVSTEGGQRLDATSRRVSGRDRLTRTVVLAIDTSRSMGARLEQAKAAAQGFVDAAPPDVQVGLVRFSTTTQVVKTPTRAHSVITRGIANLTLDLAIGTQLYQGAQQAVAVAGSGPSSQVLLLTDGRNVGGDVSLAAAQRSVRTSGVSMDAIYIGKDPQPPAGLTQLVDAAGGTVYAATAADLKRIYAAAAETLRNQVNVTVPTPPSLEGQAVNLRVSGRADGTTVSDTASAVFGTATRPVGPRPAGPGLAARLTPAGVLPVALIALFLGALGLLALALTHGEDSGSETSRMRRRLSFYTLTGRQGTTPERPESTVLGRSTVARSAVELAGRVVQQRDLEAVLARRLEAAGLPLRAAEWTLIHVGCAVGLALFLLLVSGGAVVPALLGLFLGAVLPWLYLSLAESRRTTAFMGQLPDTLQLLSGSLSAGYSLPQALDTVVREGQQPMTGEFNRALVEARLGVPIEDALEGVADRMHSKDFTWVVMAYKIQREVGGNLAELLAILAETMRERDALRRQVKALSAEGRLSGWILGLLPPVFALYLLATRPEYLRPLVTDPLGILLISIGLVLLVIGVFWMRKAVKVEV